MQAAPTAGDLWNASEGAPYVQSTMRPTIRVSAQPSFVSPVAREELNSDKFRAFHRADFTLYSAVNRRAYTPRLAIGRHRASQVVGRHRGRGGPERFREGGGRV